MKKGDEADEVRSFFKVDFRGGDVKGKGCSLNFRRGAEYVGNDDETKISCIIKNLKNEVSNITLSSSIETIQSSTNELKRSTNEMKRKYDAFKTETEEGNSNIVKRIAMLESKLEASSESIKSKIEAQSTKNNNGNVVKPKCPICFEEMSTKIAQCISGHLLCWPCKEKMGDKDCAFCDQPVNGRAFGMEAYLRTIFG